MRHEDDEKEGVRKVRVWAGRTPERDERRKIWRDLTVK
jgi:hypothetical protein